MIIDETVPDEEMMTYYDYEYAMIKYNHWLSGETINIGVIVLENEQDDLDKKQSSIKKKHVRKALCAINCFNCFINSMRRIFLKKDPSRIGEYENIDKEDESIKKKPVRKAIKTIDSFHCFADILEITEASSLDYILEWIHKDFDKDSIKYGHNACNAIFITKLDWISDHRRDIELVADALYKEMLFVKAAHDKQ